MKNGKTIDYITKRNKLERGRHIFSTSQLISQHAQMHKKQHLPYRALFYCLTIIWILQLTIQLSSFLLWNQLVFRIIFKCFLWSLLGRLVNNYTGSDNLFHQGSL